MVVHETRPLFKEFNLFKKYLLLVSLDLNNVPIHITAILYAVLIFSHTPKINRKELLYGFCPITDLNPTQN